MILSDREIRAAKICQLIFEAVDATPEMGYTGKFSVQGPAAGL